MAFIRLAGCSVGCAECDTDYRVAERAELDGIVERVVAITPLASRDRWAWLTGGEPTDHDIAPLLKALRGAGFSTALATSGVRRFIPPVDWLSVSPHDNPLAQRYGNEIKIVDGLGGLDLEDWHARNPDDTTDFMYRYAQPLTIGRGPRAGEPPGVPVPMESKHSLARCLAFVKARPNWAMSRQDHRHWGVA